MKLLKTILFLAIISIKSFTFAQTEILVLGTTHLSQMKEFNNEMLQRTLNELAKYNFDAIAIEQMPTQLLYDIASRNDSIYLDVLKSFGGHRLELANAYQTKLNLDYTTCLSRINKILKQDSISLEDRIHLIQNFLATGDLASAVLQYNYLDNYNLDNNKIDPNTLDHLKELSDSPNEIYSIAVKLAAKENLQNLEYIDNVQDEALLYAHFPEFITDYMNNQDKFKGISNLPVYKTIDSLQTISVRKNDVFPLIRYVNSSTYQSNDYKAQWEIWLNTEFPSKGDKSRLALWEMRNLQIAANIMRVSAYYPNQKILVIIGFSHKSFLEKYLNSASDIKILNFN